MHLHRPCTCVCKVTGYAAELYPALSTQYLKLMRGEKVNGEQRVITGSPRRVNVWVSQVIQRGQKDEVLKVHFIYIYMDFPTWNKNTLWHFEYSDVKKNIQKRGSPTGRQSCCNV